MVGALVFHWIEENWTFMSAIYFSFTIISTVGYGCLSPGNDSSRVFTLFFTIFRWVPYLRAACARSAWTR